MLDLWWFVEPRRVVPVSRNGLDSRRVLQQTAYDGVFELPVADAMILLKDFELLGSLEAMRVSMVRRR